VIGSPQVADPKTFFRNNYGSDPNQAIERGSRQNLIYVRAKNLSATAKSGWFITLYRASSSLFLNTGQWRTNKLTTTTGNSYVELDTVQPDGVVAAGVPFLLDAVTSPNFCLIGIASPTATPDIPPNFSTFDGFLSWVRTNRNVCGRNLTLVRNFRDRQLEVSYKLANPQNEVIPVLVIVEVTGELPAGSTFGVNCPPARLKGEWKIEEGRVQTASGLLPANFDGFLSAWGSLPAAGLWPPGVRINCKKFIGVERDAAVARWATPWEEVGIDRAEIGVLGELRNPRLVYVGNCAVQFQA
jgi:hypothetical protein